MKILYVNGANAKKFDKQVDNNITFAKYFSPSCPACIGMKDEWDDMCKDIDQKYNTDLILAEIDPDGMEGLENTHTYNDVDYVPHIVILEKGKKIKEYNGPKTKDKMIEFLLQGGYLQSKMSGGSKKSKKTKKSKKSKKSKKTKGRRKRRIYKKRIRHGAGSEQQVGSSRFKKDFSFEKNKNWLKPFLVALIQQSIHDTNITWNDARSFAIRRVDLVFRPTIAASMFTSIDEEISYIDNWNVCPSLTPTNSNCRLSKGFGNNLVPNVKKFDPKYKESKYKNTLKLARESYNFLKYSQQIKEIIDTPSSDYTRFSRDSEVESEKFIIKLRTNTDLQKNPLKVILDTYGYTPPTSFDDVQKTLSDTRELMEQTHLDIEEKLRRDPEGRKARGGRKTRRKKHNKSRHSRTRK